MNQDKVKKLLNEAEALRNDAQYNKALKISQKALALSKKNSNLNGLIDSTVFIADIYRIKGDFSRGLNKYDEAIEMCDALGLDMTAADAMVGRVLSLKAQGLWKDALKDIKKPLAYYKKINDKKGMGFSLWTQGTILRVKGYITGSIARFNAAKRLFTEIRFKSGIGYASCGLGGAFRIAGWNEKSLEHYKRANKIFLALNDKFGKAYSYCGIGNAYRMIDEYDAAMEYFKKATELYQEFGDIVSHSYTLWSIANVFKIKRDLDKGKIYLDKALKNFIKTRDMRGVAYCKLTHGEIEFMEGNHAKALKILKSALQITNSYNFALERCHAESLLNIALHLKKHGSLETLIPLSKCYKKIGVQNYLDNIPCKMP